MTWFFALAFVALPPWSVVVAAATDSSSGDPWGIGTLLVQVGRSGIFLWQWRTEREQRKARDDQVIAIVERQGPVLAQAIDVLKAVQDSQKAVVTRSATDWDDIASSLRQVTEALDAEAAKRRRPDR